MSETDDCDCHGTVEAVESEEEWPHGTLIKRAGQGCELTARERLEEPMGAGDDELKGKKGDDEVSGP